MRIPVDYSRKYSWKIRLILWKKFWHYLMLLELFRTRENEEFFNVLLNQTVTTKQGWEFQNINRNVGTEIENNRSRRARDMSGVWKILRYKLRNILFFLKAWYFEQMLGGIFFSFFVHMVNIFRFFLSLTYVWYFPFVLFYSSFTYVTYRFNLFLSFLMYHLFIYIIADGTRHHHPLEPIYSRCLFMNKREDI
jgi:hypothetical protein